MDNTHQSQSSEDNSLFKWKKTDQRRTPEVDVDVSGGVSLSPLDVDDDDDSDIKMVSKDVIHLRENKAGDLNSIKLRGFTHTRQKPTFRNNNEHLFNLNKVAPTSAKSIKAHVLNNFTPEIQYSG